MKHATSSSGDSDECSTETEPPGYGLPTLSDSFGLEVEDIAIPSPTSPTSALPIEPLSTVGFHQKTIKPLPRKRKIVSELARTADQVKRRKINDAELIGEPQCVVANNIKDVVFLDRPCDRPNLRSSKRLAAKKKKPLEVNEEHIDSETDLGGDDEYVQSTRSPANHRKAHMGTDLKCTIQGCRNPGPFGRAADLCRHKLFVHRTRTQEIHQLLCRWCGKTLSRPDARQRHEGTCDEGEPSSFFALVSPVYSVHQHLRTAVDQARETEDYLLIAFCNISTYL